MSNQYPSQPGPQQPFGPPAHTPATPAKPPVYKRTWVKVTVAAALAFFVGIGAGSASGVEDSPVYLESQKALKSANGQVETLTGDLKTANSQKDANEAKAAELDKREAGLDKRKSDMDGRATKMDAREKKLSGAEDKAAKKAEMSTIDGDGLYVVGDDILPGTYKTSGGSGCYWSIAPSTEDLDEIVDNNITDGPSVVTVKEGQVLEVNRCGTWTRR